MILHALAFVALAQATQPTIYVPVPVPTPVPVTATDWTSPGTWVALISALTALVIAIRNMNESTAKRERDRMTASHLERVDNRVTGLERDMIPPAAMTARLGPVPPVDFNAAQLAEERRAAAEEGGRRRDDPPHGEPTDGNVDRPPSGPQPGRG